MSLYHIETDGDQRYVEANSMEDALDVFKKWWITEDEELIIGSSKGVSVTLICLEDVIRAKNKGE